MTVQELINQLQLLPPDSVVVVNMGRNEMANGREVGKIDIEEGYKWPGESMWYVNYYPEVNNWDDAEIKTKVVNLTPY